MQSSQCRVQNDYNHSVTEGDTSLCTREACTDKTGDESVEASVARPSDDASEESTDNPPAETASGGLAHLTSSVPRAARVPRGALSKTQLTELRELFGGLSDADIQRLYKRVTK